MKEYIKKILKDYPTLFKVAKFIRWLPKNAMQYLAIKLARIFHFKDVISADLILSIGNHCHAAYYMQEYNLRKFASPIDWMKYYSLDSLLELFRNDFNSFFINHYEDFEKAQDNGKCRWLVDKNNGMIARHHFLKEYPLEKQFENFYKKQMQRFSKIKNYLRSAKSIAFISCREDSIEDMKKFLLGFYKLYNIKLTIINFRNDKNNEYKQTITINEDLSIIEYCFDNTYPLKKNQTLQDVGEISWIGNYKKWGGV
ncbi:DUF1796 family putative cysteine peptidase [Helicobacter sp. MIT 14-3879]|uniref:DUF1796 family putative cysteine peptidase n=1 Tax=Helicobacter sp. MIT 14-3879 TaxID=2040649 RepID=UPI000E1E56C6|nr:DUF1796 family putative cysteine peptidase [Helicobacter sp. MIT 14-3879]RDU64778.1 hypothetical protein CQA44_03445 [Helicobacter sp. MIT 14-3879]